MTKWWDTFTVWIDGPTVTLAVIPMGGNVIIGTQRLRKNLRDIRDREARHDYRWSAVAFAGLVSGGCVVLLIRHHGVNRTELSQVLIRRWPEVALHDAGQIGPGSSLSIADAADLGRRKRGIEGYRIVVMPQTGSSPTPDEPMPFLF